MGFNSGFKGLNNQVNNRIIIFLHIKLIRCTFRYAKIIQLFVRHMKPKFTDLFVVFRYNFHLIVYILTFLLVNSLDFFSPLSPCIEYLDGGHSVLLPPSRNFDGAVTSYSTTQL